MLEMATAGERLPVVSIGWLAIEAVRTSRLAIAKIIIKHWTQRLQQQGIINEPKLSTINPLTTGLKGNILEVERELAVGKQPTLSWLTRKLR